MIRGRSWAVMLCGLALVAGIALAFVALRDSPVAAAIEAQTLAWRFQLRGPIAPPPGVVVVAIDDRTIARTGWPVPRAVLAQAVKRLSEAGAHAIALDLLLLDADRAGSEPSGDEALRTALAAAGNGILATALTFGRGDAPVDDPALRRALFRAVTAPPGSVPGLVATGALLPLPALRDGAVLAHVNLPVPDDGLVRQLPVAIAVAGGWLPAMPVELARRLAGVPPARVSLVIGDAVLLDARRVPLDRAGQLTINFYGPERTMATVSLVDVLDGAAPALAGRGVIVGASALGVGDTFTTPFSRTYPGVEILATAAANILAGQAIEAGDGAASWSLLAVLLFGAAGLAVAVFGPGAAAASVFALLAVLSGIAQWALAEHQLWLNVTFPAGAIVLSAAFGTALRWRADVRARRRLEGYHSPLIADLLARGETVAADAARDAAILFIDIVGSTARSERSGPLATAAFLRGFHARLEGPVLAHRGLMEQLSGDGAMVMFGVPTSSAHDCAAALACALELADRMTAWSAELVAAGDEALSIGIGIHYGPIVVTHLGGALTRHLTAAGGTVNVASRLQALTRDHGAVIAISEAAVNAVRRANRGDLLAGFRPLPPQAIRGLDSPLGVWTKPVQA